jgi:hypothetical protein
MKKTILLVSLAILVTTITIAFYAYYNIPAVTAEAYTEQPVEADKVDFGFVDTVYVSKNGQLIAEGHNLVTNTGLDALKVCWSVNASCGTPTAYDFIAVGGNTSALAAADTSLANEVSGNGFARAFGTYTTLGTGDWKIEKIFTATGTQNNINSTGLLNQSATGIMFAEYPFGNTNFISGDTLNITWRITATGT